MRKPRPYQAEDAQWLLERTHALYSAQPGLGKTGVGLKVHDALDVPHGLLVVCPKAALAVWRDEPALWGLDLRPKVLTNARDWRWPEPGEALIVNFAKMPWTPKQIREAIAQGKNPGQPIGDPADPIMMVVDECQALKSNKSQRNIRARALRRKAARCVGLSGTPVGGTPFDTYHTLNALGCCPWSWFTFLRRYNAFEMPHGGYDFARDEKGNIRVDPRVPVELSRVLRRRLRKDVAADLPPKLYRYRTIPHRRDTKGALKELHEKLAPYYDSNDLPELADFSYVDALIAQERIPHIPDAQREREDRGEIGLIFSAHTAPLLAAAQRPGWAAIYGATPQSERERLIAAFEAGQLRGLALNIKTAATAINLPSADYEIFVDTTWDPDEQEQAEDRPNRLNRVKGPIEIEIWVSGNTVCKHRRKVLDRKRALARATLGE